MAGLVDEVQNGQGISLLRGRTNPAADSGNPTTLTNSATIPSTETIQRVTNGGAVTGIILAKGDHDGRILIIINHAANSVTFAADATSNVLDGTNIVIAAKRACVLVWDRQQGLWVACKSA